jgi:hypothetical protein
VDHLGAAIDLLVAVGNGDRVELATELSPRRMQDGYFQVIGGTGLDLGPGNLGVVATAVAALGDEVVDAALAVPSPGYQFCTVEYLISASSSATSSTTAA